MAKWQLTLIQNGKKLRKFGECRWLVYETLKSMIEDIESHANPSLPYQFVISKYNNIKNKKKKVVEVRCFD